MEIKITLENKNGEIKVIQSKAPWKFAILPLCLKLKKYANENWRLKKVYCDDLQVLGLLMQGLKETDAEFVMFDIVEEIKK